MNFKVDEKIRLSLALISSKLPFLNSLIFAIEFVECDEVLTAGVDKYLRIYYNPGFFESITVQEVAGILLHEVLHVLLIHFVRLKNFPLIVANIAADCEVNQVVLKAGFNLPSGVLLPKILNFIENLIAEEYALILMSKFPPQCGSENEFNCNGCKFGEKFGRVYCNNPYGEGSGVTGKPAPWEKKIPRSDLSEEQICRISKEALEGLREKSKKLRGWRELWVKRLVETFSISRINWKAELGALLTNIKVDLIKGKVNFSRFFISKKSFASGVIFPGLETPVLRIGYLIDTSASVSDSELLVGISEAIGIAKKLGYEVLIWDGDVKLKREKPLIVKGIFKPPKIELEGLGGTSMRECLIQISKLPISKTLSAMVVFTDGYTDWPETNVLRIPTFVILTCTGWVEKVPKWVKKVLITSPIYLKRDSYQI
ncbi:MAG: VWA-like domain-containing protein [candidate division WOR-3 bacterium]